MKVVRMYILVAIYNDGILRQEIVKNGWALIKAISALDYENLLSICVTPIHPQIIQESKEND